MEIANTMDPFSHVHHHYLDPNTLSPLHLWVLENHIWVVPLFVFTVVLVTTLITMKLYLWWRFDRFESAKERLKRIRRQF